MNSLTILGKYLDQPRLVGYFSRAVPAILITGGAAYTYNHVKKTPKEEKQKELIKSIAVMVGTIGAALIAPKLARKIVRGAHHAQVHGHCDCHEHSSDSLNLSKIKEKNTKIIDEFLKQNKVSETTEKYLNIAKEKILSRRQIKTIFEELGNNPKANEFLSGEDGLIPDPENIDSKHIFSEIGRISVLGLIPVLGGITGGIIGDKLVEKDWKDRIPDKVKEGTYQYLANIVLCNVGAGIALWGMEQAKITSKSARALGMVTGIVLAGLVFGSAVANLIGKTCIDPLLHRKEKKHVHHHVDLYSERKPEILDAGLHIDDVATVAVLSGLKWIEPALPILYSISGYRAGIGYRNVDEKIDFSG